jgi:hypothetical protein
MSPSPRLAPYAHITYTMKVALKALYIVTTTVVLILPDVPRGSIWRTLHDLANSPGAR